VRTVTKRRACPPAPGPLEAYAAQFDPLLARLAQRRGLRAYLQGLLLPRDRNKTMTALAGAEPITGAQHAAVQGLQWFLTESTWDHERVNQRRVQLLREDPATAPHEQGVLVLDDSGDRKAGTKTAHVARQWLGSLGKADNGIVAVTSPWADERLYWPVDVVPYTPASRLAKGKRDPAFRTKPQLAAELVSAAKQAQIPFRAVVADCFYGDNTGLVEALGRAGVAYVLAVKPRKGVWAPEDAAHTPVEAARELAWTSPEQPGDWTRSPAGSATATPRPGGRLMRACPPPAGSGPAYPAGGGHHRPRHVAEADHLVPGHQPAPTCRPAAPSGLRAGRPGRGGAPLRPAQLGRAGLQAG
jgi:SRSO17 transposase